MGIIPLTGTTPKKSYTRSGPASESLNNPIPPLSTHCVWLERERANEQELLTERKNTFILGHVPLQRQPIYVSWKMVVFLFFMLSPFLSRYLWHPLLMALITDISQDPYQLGFSCLCFNMSPLWKSSLRQWTLRVSLRPTNRVARPVSLSSLSQEKKPSYFDFQLKLSSMKL